MSSSLSESLYQNPQYPQQGLERRGEGGAIRRPSSARYGSSCGRGGRGSLGITSGRTLFAT